VDRHAARVAGPGDGRLTPLRDDHRVLHVPVHVCGANMVTIRTGRLPSGERVGLGFTTAAGLTAVFGTGQDWVLIQLRSLRAMLAGGGVLAVQVDPLISRPAGAAARSPRPVSSAAAPMNATAMMISSSR
jgi:hypothetical protein